MASVRQCRAFLWSNGAGVDGDDISDAVHADVDALGGALESLGCHTSRGPIDGLHGLSAKQLRSAVDAACREDFSSYDGVFVLLAGVCASLPADVERPGGY
jgi:hypothetical protein